MPKLEKTQLLRAMARYVLEKGLGSASLRPLAEAAGTSDRMLIYHFGSKERLIEELLTFLGAEMEAGLETALPLNKALSNKAFLAQAVALIRTPAFQPYLRISLEIASASAFGSRSHHAAGGAIVDGFLRWILAQLPEKESDQEGLAALMLTLVEGVIFMDAVGRSDIADAAIDRLPAGE